MSTVDKNLSSFDETNLPDASSMRIGIVVSEWNNDITDNLCSGAAELIRKAGIREENLIIKQVPGTFELPSAAAMLLDSRKVDGVICLGSVIRGETSHFDYVCQAAAAGVKDVAIKYVKPVIFGVLTDDNRQQAIDRSGGQHGNKGIEAAVSCIKMIALEKEVKASWGTGFN